MSEENGIDQMLKDCKGKESKVIDNSNKNFNDTIDDTMDRVNNAFSATQIEDLKDALQKKKSPIDDELIMHGLKDNWTDPNDANLCTDCDCIVNHYCDCDCHKIKRTTKQVVEEINKVCDDSIEQEESSKERSKRIKKEVNADMDSGVIKLSPVTMIIEMSDFQDMRSIVETLVHRRNDEHNFGKGVSVTIRIKPNRNLIRLKRILDKYEYMEHEGFGTPEKPIDNIRFGVGMLVEDSELGRAIISRITPDEFFCINVYFPNGVLHTYDVDGIAFRNGPNPDFSKDLIRIKPFTDNIKNPIFKVDMNIISADGETGVVSKIETNLVNPEHSKMIVHFDNNIISYSYDLKGKETGAMGKSVIFPFETNFENSLFKKESRVKNLKDEIGTVLLVNYIEKWVRVTFDNVSVWDFDFDGNQITDGFKDHIILYKD